jgi:hypothetical protein
VAARSQHFLRWSSAAPAVAPGGFGFITSKREMRTTPTAGNLGFENADVASGTAEVAAGDCRSPPRRPFEPSKLPPISFHQNITAIAAYIMMRDPVGVRPRRLFPPPRGPCIGVAVPTMVAANPNMLAARRRSAPLNNHMRRRDVNHNIGSSGTKDQRTRKNQSDHFF